MGDCGEGVVDDVAEGVVGAVLGVDAAHNINDSYVGDIVDVDVGAVAELFQIERSAVTHAVFTSQIVDEGGIHTACAANLGAGLCERSGREADKMLAVRAHLYHGQF